jgi:hypothetical protein
MGVLEVIIHQGFKANWTSAERSGFHDLRIASKNGWYRSACLHRVRGHG